MWATLALATALNVAPAQSATLQLKNDRVTYGALGQVRKETKFLGGDLVVIAFDIEGLKERDDGFVKYSMSMDVLNSEGKSQFRQDPVDLEVFTALGGGRVPGLAFVFVGNDQPEGEYTAKVTIKDRSTDTSATLIRKFEVVQHRFGFVQVGLSHRDAPTLAAPQVAGVGEALDLNFSVVGFELDKSRKDQPSIETSLRILDEDGKPTLAKPYGGLANEAPPEYKKGLPMKFSLYLNRPGKFKLEVKATDKVAKKNATLLLDLTVVEAK
jgi:hypothetical protein